ncbi:MAG: alpha-L-fucosidase [Bacteroidales bacterium]|nr:alpha-L-fucosidase [Bacteroidales bacterium]
MNAIFQLKSRIAFLAALLVATLPLSAQPDYVPSPEILKARSEFQDDKFGIMICWGIYSMMGDGEWVMNDKNLNWEEYAKLAEGFYPSKFNAAEWVSAIKASGARYINFVSRHHDSFSMFKSEASDFNIVDATPFGRDVLKELSDECHRQGIKLHIYYSQLDWRRPDYPAGGNTGKNNSRVQRPDPDSYFAFMRTQLTELLTNYGPVSSIWYDGWWDRPDQEWDMDAQYALIHRLQPSCMVGSNHHRAPFPGEDFQMFERDLPGENTIGWNDKAEVGNLPLETCETLNGMWGYRITDQNYKDKKTLVQYLVKAAGKNANLLMCVGPQPNGEFPALSTKALSDYGEWMSEFGDTIYGTRSTAVPPQSWGVTTHKGNRMFVHILSAEGNTVFIPYAGNRLKTATVFSSGEKISFKSLKDGITLQFKDTPADEIDYIVELTFADSI